MKTTQKNTFKRIVYFVFMALLMTSCERDDKSTTEQEHQKAEINYFNVEELPEVANAIANLEINNSSNSSSRQSMNTNFGELNLTNILEYVNNDGKPTYSFMVEKELSIESPYAFENLHLVKVADGYLGYILKWEPEKQWFENNNLSFLIEDFTGTQTHYDLDYNIINVTQFVNGQPSSSADANGRINNQSRSMDMYISCVTITVSLCNGIPYDCGGGVCGFGSYTDCTVQYGGGGSSGSGSSGGSGTTIPTGGGSGSPTVVGDGNAIVIPVIPTRLDRETDAFFDNLTDEQKECLNPNSGQAHYSTVKDITAYFENNQTTGGTGYDGTVINPQATTLATAAIDAMCNGVGENFQEALDIVISLIIEDEIVDDNLDDCSKGILGELKTLQSNDIAEIIKRFGDLNAPYDWEIKTGTPTNSNNVFETDWVRDPNNNNISYQYLTIANASYVNQATKLAIARTILHEAIHAYMLSYYDDFLSDPTANVSILQSDFSEIWNFLVARTYGTTVDNIEDAQHKQMAASFIEIMRDALAEYDNNQQDSTYYEYLAWGALFNTDAWISAQGSGGYIDFNEAEAIVIANNQEDTNGPAANGSPCP